MTAAVSTPLPFNPSPKRYVGVTPAIGLTVALALHALVFTLAGHLPTGKPAREPDKPTVITLTLLPPEREAAAPAREPERPPAPRPAILPLDELAVAPPPQAPPRPASAAAPPAPSAEEWAFAGRYTLKNSKAYRYTWGQQVRSMMGTAVEGPDQGMVRFRVEIAPDGSLARLETLWSTSAVAERLARQAIISLPRWPAPPTGRPLIFEKTILFTPFASDGPPLYKHDCEPDPPAFRNPYAWDGKTVREPTPVAPPNEPQDPQALADCLEQLPKDSIDAESARDQRVMDRWGWSSNKLGR